MSSSVFDTGISQLVGVVSLVSDGHSRGMGAFYLQCCKLDIGIAVLESTLQGLHSILGLDAF